MKKLSYRILIVDDEIGILQLLQDYFEIQGYEVLTAQNGEEAIEKAMEDLDLILLDINLPDIDGLHVCQEIREKIECPILFLTAKIEEQDRLSMNPGRIFSKEQIYEQVRGIDGTGDNTIITEHIRRIRNKISAYTDREYIKTVWGVGYQWIG